MNETAPPTPAAWSRREDSGAGRPLWLGAPTRTWVLLFALCGLLRSVSLARPCLSDDEATYCVVAREMLRGHVLYRDVVDHKPPLVYLTYEATQWLGGPTGGMRLLHLLTILVVFATALLLAGIARRHRDGEEADPTGAVAAALYVVFTTTLFDFDSLAANCELFMLLPLTASVALFLAPPQGRPVRELARLFAVGLLVGVGMLYKYQAGIHLPLYGLWLLWIGRARIGRALGGVATLGLGCVAALAGAALLLERYGALASTLFWFRFNFAYIKEGLSPGEVLGRAAVRVSFVVAAGALLYLLGGRAVVAIVRSWRARPTFDRFCVTWAVASATAVQTGGRFFGHYFHQLAAPLAVLAAPAALSLWRRRRVLAAAAVAVPAALFFVLGLFHARIWRLAGHPDPDYAAIARFVDAHSGPGDAIAVWGNSPVLYFDADRPLGSRFVFSNYQSGMSPATRTQSDPHADASANVVPESWDWFSEDMAQRRPRLFIDTSPGDIAGYGKFPVAHFPRLSATLARDYRPIGEVAGAVVYQRRDRS